MRFEISAPSDTAELVGALHDRWIDVTALERVGEEVRIPITAEPRVKPSARHFSHRLTIAPVSSVAVEDTEGVGYYDVHSVELDAAARKLSFRFNIPLGLELGFESLPLVLEIAEV